MIQYSFSPNWYRAQCMGFSKQKRVFYYCSNCIVYRYDMSERRIVSELNLKNWLIKKEGFNLSAALNKSINTNNVQRQSIIQNNRMEQKSSSVPQSGNNTNRNKQSIIDRQKTLKINSIHLIEQTSQKQQEQLLIQEQLLVIGFNCLSIIVLVEYNKEDSQQLRVRQVVDLNQLTNTEITGVEYIYCQRLLKNDIIQRCQQSVNIVIFSLEGVKINLMFNMEISDTNNQRIKLLSWNRVIDNNNTKKNRSLQIKSIIKDSYQLTSAIQQQHHIKQTQQFYTVFLANNIPSNNNNNPIQQQRSKNIIFYDSDFQEIIKMSSINQILLSNSQQINKQIYDNKSQPYQQKQQLSSSVVELSSSVVELSSSVVELPSSVVENIISVDSIKNEKNKTNSKTKYTVLSKVQNNNSNKQNIFCQSFYLYTFSSKHLLSQLQKEQIDNNSQYSQQIIRTKIQIIYPKKIHHKLTQQQKSTLCVKFINSNYILLTGRLGQMIIINLRQIQLQSQINFRQIQFQSQINNKQKKQTNTISIRPYSYEQENNKVWRIEHSQRHYKDIYAIYNIDQHRNIDTQKEHQNDKKLFLIGTDHILTSWKASTNTQLSDINNPQLLTYLSNLKFLTSSVDQIVLSQLQPSLVFLKLRDSNVRSFQPFCEGSYWLNQFWKHTNVSFCKEIQKLLIHPKDIGVTAMVNKQGKIILYDLYEERLIRLIEIKHINNDKNISTQQIKQQIIDKYHHNQRSRHNNDTQNKQQKYKKQHRFQKQIQINSISFEHKSILSSLQSMYALHPTFQQVDKKLVIDVKCQQFYQKALDKQTVIMIQSNQFIIILMQNPKQPRYMRFQIYKKVFKLQRVYKSKYWDGKVLIGTRKKKGQLMVDVSVNSNMFNNNNFIYQEKSQLAPQSQSLYNSLQQQISLPLGVSSRYIFKLSLQSIDSNTDDPLYNILSVINYKGSKLCIAVYKLTININNKEIELSEILVSEQLAIPNLTSTNNQYQSSNINIQHLIVSQQSNQYFIAVYNNLSQSITVIDYSSLVRQAVNNVSLRNSHLNNKQVVILTQKQVVILTQKQVVILTQKQVAILTQKQEENINSYKRDFVQFNQQQQVNSQIKNQKNTLSDNLTTIELTQFSELSYKIESMMFNNVYCDKQQQNISHLIILGKDQSVRLLNLNQHLNVFNTNNLSNSKQIKVHQKVIKLKTQFVNKLQSKEQNNDIPLTV